MTAAPTIAPTIVDTAFHPQDQDCFQREMRNSGRQASMLEEGPQLAALVSTTVRGQQVPTRGGGHPQANANRFSRRVKQVDDHSEQAEEGQVWTQSLVLSMNLRLLDTQL